MKQIKLLTMAAAILAASTTANAAIISGLAGGSHQTESFSGQEVWTNAYNFAGGLSYSNLFGQADGVNYTGGYGMGTEPYVNGGKGGGGYFGTGPTPTSFQFFFAGGTADFGFWGAESSVEDGSSGRNGILDLEFYGLDNALLGMLSISTLGTFAWDQFHAFQSNGALIGSVVFRDVGHMVLDELVFSGEVPEPASLALVATGLLALGARRRKLPC